MGRSVVLTLTVLLVPVLAFAGTVGKIAGRVYDADTGEPLIGANVEIVGTMRGAVVGDDGLFYVVNLDPSTYSVRASMIGYGPMVVDDVIVMADLTSELQFALTQTPIEAEEVVVIAERPLIQKDLTASTKIARREQIEAMPVTTFDQVLAAGPGTSGGQNNLHVRGGRAGEVVYLVDGMRVDDPQVRQYALQVGTGAIDEMQLISGGFNAEYGDAQSGVVLLNTREGSPEGYSGKVLYKTDDFGGEGLTDASRNEDYMEGSLGGPEPITGYLLPALGVDVPGEVTLFASGESRFRDRANFHADALEEAGVFRRSIPEPFVDDNNNGRYDEGEDFTDCSGDGSYGEYDLVPWYDGDIALGDVTAPRALGTSEQFRHSTWLEDLLGVGGKRENTLNNANIKLTHQITPSHRLSLSYRRTQQAIHGWHFTQNTNLTEMVHWAQSLGIDDNVDNDGDGRVDEEIFDGVDNDGDGVVDEYDGHLVDPAEVSGGRGYGFGWWIDEDGDGQVDEEPLNGIDDDGDGLVDEDLQRYDYNGWDKMHKTESSGDQYLLSWTHSLSPSTFYELKLSYFDAENNWLPKVGRDGLSAATREEIEDWLVEYESARSRLQRYINVTGAWDEDREAVIEEAIRTGRFPDMSPEELAAIMDELGPRIEYLVDPFWGFGTPPEPFADVNGNGRYDPGTEEVFTDLDGDGYWDENNRQNEIWWFEGANNPFRGMIYYGYPGYNNDTDPQYFRSGFRFRDSKTWSAKADLTSQLDAHHQVKTGLEYRYYDLYWLSRQLISPYDGRGLFGNEYHVYPAELSAYVQDKMEYKSAIVNAGLRFEYFDQGNQVAEEDTSSVSIPSYEIIAPEELSRKPEAKLNLLPRFGISFPVTDRDVFHFFYGHFFQRPRLFDVYNQVNQVIDSANSIVGNPNMEPERTISYEFGLKHQMGANTVLSVTGFFKDIDNLRQIEKVEDANGNVFRTYLNDTYATAKGFEFLLSQRMGARFSGEASYTYQRATTTHSFARHTYGNEDTFRYMPGQEFPADWDRRHSVNVNLDYRYGEDEGPALGSFKPLENWNIDLLFAFGTGYPFTPTRSEDSPIYERTNSERYPSSWNLDLSTRKFIDIAGARLGLLLEVLNVFNVKRVVGADDAFGNAGAESYRTIIDAYRAWQPGADVEDWIGYSNQSPATTFRNYGGYPLTWPIPSAWDSGRRVSVGVSVEF
jgi:outer membrane receptor protein involved in Fe transport